MTATFEMPPQELDSSQWRWDWRSGLTALCSAGDLTGMAKCATPPRELGSCRSRSSLEHVACAGSNVSNLILHSAEEEKAYHFCPLLHSDSIEYSPPEPPSTLTRAATSQSDLHAGQSRTRTRTQTGKRQRGKSNRIATRTRNCTGMKKVMDQIFKN